MEPRFFEAGCVHNGMILHATACDSEDKLFLSCYVACFPLLQTIAAMVRKCAKEGCEVKVTRLPPNCRPRREAANGGLWKFCVEFGS